MSKWKVIALRKLQLPPAVLILHWFPFRTNTDLSHYVSTTGYIPLHGKGTLGEVTDGTTPLSLAFISRKGADRVFWGPSTTTLNRKQTEKEAWFLLLPWGQCHCSVQVMPVSGIRGAQRKPGWEWLGLWGHVPHFFSPLGSNPNWAMGVLFGLRLFQPGFQEPLGFSTSLFSFIFLHTSFIDRSGCCRKELDLDPNWFDFWFCCSRAIVALSTLHTFALGLFFSLCRCDPLTHRADTTVKSTKNVRVSQILSLATLMAMRGSPHQGGPSGRRCDFLECLVFYLKKNLCVFCLFSDWF